MQAENTPAQIRWRCRRGMLELDMILIPFFDKCFNKLSPSDQGIFAELLEAPDTELHAWLLGHQNPTDPNLCEMVILIKSSLIQKDKQ